MLFFSHCSLLLFPFTARSVLRLPRYLLPCACTRTIREAGSNPSCTLLSGSDFHLRTRKDASELRIKGRRHDEDSFSTFVRCDNAWSPTRTSGKYRFLHSPWCSVIRTRCNWLFTFPNFMLAITTGQCAHLGTSSVYMKCFVNMNL